MIEQRHFDSPQSAHAAFLELYAIAKKKTRHGAGYALQLVSVNPVLRHQLRKAFHGPVLQDISSQVWVTRGNGLVAHHSKAAWKEFYRAMLIPPVPQEYTVKATGQVKVRMVKQSTEDLSDDDFQLFLLQLQAHAVTELGVVFTEQEE